MLTWSGIPSIREVQCASRFLDPQRRHFRRFPTPRIDGCGGSHAPMSCIAREARPLHLEKTTLEDIAQQIALLAPTSALMAAASHKPGAAFRKIRALFAVA